MTADGAVEPLKKKSDKLDPSVETEEPAAESEAMGTVSQAVVDNTYAVGVIPVGPGGQESALYGTTCPLDSSLVTLYMDDEDGSNNTAWGTWRTPPDTNPGLFYGLDGWNTRLRFCKVNGQGFRPLTTNINDKSRFYAVLKLGQTCPNGSTEISRYFDNEDDSNENSRSGPIAPNVSNSNTTLRFCFFRSGTTIMASFPNLGIQYAVYHDFDGAQPAPFNVAKAKHYSDDEDNGNENNVSPAGTSAYYDFVNIIGSGPNTWFELARVH